MPDAPSHAASAPRYYQPADRFGAGLWFYLPVVGGLGAVALGAAYAFLACLGHVIEEVGWIAIVTPFFAVGLFGVSRWVCHLGNVRARRLRLPIALGIGAAGLYLAWQFYLVFIGDAERGLFSVQPTLRMSPGRLWHAMRELAYERGWSSWLLWLIEAATVFGFIVYMTEDSGDPETPFCEHCNHWTEQTFAVQLSDGRYDSAVTQFKQGRVDGLRKLGAKPDRAKTYLQVRVLECQCHRSRYATVERVTTIPGTKGKIGFKRQTAVSSLYLDIDPGSSESLKASPILTNLELDADAHQQLVKLQTDLAKE